MKSRRIITIVIFITVILGIFLFIYFLNKRNNITFYLNGEESITLAYGSKYIEPGFVAKDGYGNSIEDKVVITGIVDIKVPGIYKVTYELSYNDIKKTLMRIITVKNVTADNLKIVLNGDESIYLLKGANYQEEGAKVFNKLDNSIFSEEVEISSNINTNIVGKYTVDYIFNYSNQEIIANRKIIVFDAKEIISPNYLTSKKVEIELDIEGVDNYLNTELPNGKIAVSKKIIYEVDSNGEYNFIIKLSNNQKFTKTITVNNIIDNYICSGEITNNGTTINVSPTSTDIKEYEWIINNQTIKGTSTFSKDKIVTSAKVNIKFNNDTNYQINCNITDKLIYHFKYDENNTKPFMSCNTYTEQDRIRLEEQLKKVVAEAGYGTRAGVVAAARFLVGGLDYKVPYVGASRYDKVGLNIGQKNAWGCRNYGLDCFYFVYWALSQNGLPLGALYAGTKYNSQEDVNNIRVGDYMYSPCTSDTCKNKYRINHIGLVIGVDDKNIYVAEATTGNINALVVTKLYKDNMPSKGKFSLVRHVEYPSDGNLTNMWMGE